MELKDRCRSNEKHAISRDFAFDQIEKIGSRIYETFLVENNENFAGSRNVPSFSDKKLSIRESAEPKFLNSNVPRPISNSLRGEGTSGARSAFNFEFLKRGGTIFRIHTYPN